MLDFFRQNLRWLLAGAVLAFGSSFGQTFFISVFADDIRTTFGLSHGQWGWIYFAGTLTSAIVMLWAGTLSDVFRVRQLGPVFVGLLALSCLFMALNPVVWLLPVVIFCLRFTGQGMCSHVAVVAMSRWFVANRGKAVAFAALGYSVGEALLPMLFIALLVTVAWQSLWLVTGGICLALIPALLWLLQSERSPQSTLVSEEGAGMLSRHWSRKDMLGHPLFWMMIPAIAGPSAFITAFFFFQEHYATMRGISHLQLAVVFPAYTLAAIGTMIVSGILVDWLGANRLVHFVHLPLVAGFFLFAMTDGYWPIVAGMMFLGMSNGASGTIINAFWAEFYGTQFLGAIKSVGTSLMVFGSALGPVIIGSNLDRGFGIDVQYSWVAGFFCVTTLLMTVGVSRWRRTLSPRAS